MTPRTIRLDQAKLLKAIDANGKPLVEEPQPEQPQILVQPNITFSPEIKIPQIEIPAINVEQPVVNVAAPSMQPIAEAIQKSIENIQPPIVQVSAPDMAPIADAMLMLADAVQGKPDHSEAIKDLLQKIADRPTTAQWSFNITRDNHGNISDIKAIKETEHGVIQ